MKAFTTWSNTGDALCCAQLRQGHRLGTSETLKSFAPHLVFLLVGERLDGWHCEETPPCRLGRGVEPLRPRLGAPSAASGKPLPAGGGWRPGPHHPLPAGGTGSRSGGVLKAPGISPSSHTSIKHPGKPGSASCQSGWSQRAAQTLTASAEMPPLEALLILTSGRGREETMKVPMLTSQLLLCSRSLSLYTLQHES